MIDFATVGRFFSNSGKVVTPKVNNVYVGVDLTFSSLHLGHILAFSCAYSLAKKHGKSLVVVLGDYTTLVGGDHSGRTTTRLQFSVREVYRHLVSLAKQLSYMFPEATLVVNSSWLKDLTLLQLIGFTSKVNVRETLRRSTFQHLNPLTLNQLIYPTLQGYDFYYLNHQFEVNVQVGGEDQMHNVLTGIGLIEDEAYGFFLPLLEDTSGLKLSKSEASNFFPWADRSLCPDRNFQFLTSKLIPQSLLNSLNVSKNDLVRYLCELRGGQYLPKGDSVVNFNYRDLISFMTEVLGAKNRKNAKDSLTNGNLLVNDQRVERGYLLKKYDVVKKGKRKILIA